MAIFSNTSASDNVTGTQMSDDFLIPEGTLGLGDDRFFGGYGFDVAMGGLGQDMLYGGNDGDRLFGGDGNDSLYGGYGDDYLAGGAGNDALFGGDGFDVAQFDRAVTLIQQFGTYSVTGDGFQAQINGIEAFYLSDFADRFTGNSLANSAYGGGGDDTLRGLAGNDRFCTGDGQDQVYGGSGADGILAAGFSGNKLLSGGTGDDYIALGLDDDLCYGGAGNDTLNLFELGNTSADTIFGEDGNDTIGTTGGDDHLFGGAGHDLLQTAYASSGSINLRLARQTIANGASVLTFAGFEDVTLISAGLRIIGTDGANVIRTVGGDDVVAGLGGNDTIEGGSGQDRLYGSTGDDTLIHGVVVGDQRAADTFSGGTGRDTFVFAHLDDRPTAQNSTDRITDFAHGQDQIDLRGQVLFFEDTARPITYHFIARAAFSGLQDELRFADGQLQGDVNGDKRADFVLSLTGVTTLSAADLLV
jgi:Ca2+-binding RTX toxin-like protein